MAASRTAVILVAACLLPGARAVADFGDELDTGGGGISARYVIHAASAQEQGHVSQAVDLSNRALTLYQSFIRARFTRGRTELAAGDTAAAIADFDQVIAAHPKYPAVYALRAEAHLFAMTPPTPSTTLTGRRGHRSAAGRGLVRTSWPSAASPMNPPARTRQRWPTSRTPSARSRSPRTTHRC